MYGVWKLINITHCQMIKFLVPKEKMGGIRAQFSPIPSGLALGDLVQTRAAAKLGKNKQEWTTLDQQNHSYVFYKNLLIQKQCSTIKALRNTG